MKTFCFLTLFIILTSANAATYIPKGEVEFTAKGFPSFITIKGKGKGISGVIEMEGNLLKSGKIQFPLKTLKTGMDLRDEHMHDKYLETKKYPMAILTLPQVTLEKSGTIEGSLKLHNVSKKVSIDYEAASTSPLMTKASFSIVLGDFGIDIPSFQGITVAKDIKINVDLKAKQK